MSRGIHARPMHVHMISENASSKSAGQTNQSHRHSLKSSILTSPECSLPRLLMWYNCLKCSRLYRPKRYLVSKDHMSNLSIVCLLMSFRLLTINRYDQSLTEIVSGDCATWFSERLAYILAFVTQKQKQMRF